MNPIQSFEQVLIQEMKHLTNESEVFNWKEIFIDGGVVDFHDSEVSFRFYNGTYQERYYFHYDYEMLQGGLFKEDGEQKITIQTWGKPCLEE